MIGIFDDLDEEAIVKQIDGLHGEEIAGRKYGRSR